MNEVNFIVKALGLEDLSAKVIEFLMSFASYSASRNKVIQTLRTSVQYEDELTTEINRLKALGLVAELETQSGSRLKLAKDIRALDANAVKAITSIARQLVDTTDDFNVLLNNVKRSCKKIRISNLNSNAYRLITTCVLISTRKWGIVNHSVIKVEKKDVEKSQVNLFESSFTQPSRTFRSILVSDAQSKSLNHIQAKDKNNLKGDKTMTVNWVEIAKRILEEENASLHVDKIAKIALERKLIVGNDIKKIASKFSAALSNNLKAKKTETILFAKVPNGRKGYTKGVYKLKRTRVQSTITPDIIEMESKNHTNYVGKAGEFSVLSELLFRGFNASIMTVDEGIDIVASKNNKYFHIQIKTANVNSSLASYTFTVNKTSFSANNSSGTFYVFVLRKQIHKRWINDFVILPSSEVHRLVLNNVIRDSDKFSIRINEDSKQQFIVNGAENVSNFVNNFGVIK